MFSASSLRESGPIDLVQLKAATMGDTALAREVLTLFARHAPVLLSQMDEASGAIPAVAHTFKGSARGIGAHEVALAAERLEAASDADECAAALGDLGRAVEAALAAIERLTEADPA